MRSYEQNAKRTCITKRFAMIGWAIPVVVALFSGSLASAEDKPAKQKPAVQMWFGTLEAGAAKLRLLVTLVPTERGFRGNLVSLDQGESEIPIDLIVQDNERLNFTIKRIKGAFTGKLNEDRTEAKGTWTQSGSKRELILRRIENQPESKASAKTGNRPQSEEFPKRAPFTGVRWEGQKPLVEIGMKWYTLVSLDGISAEDIVAFSRRTYGNKWQKRFAEDLVEVLAGMGHKPKETVHLVVIPPGTTKSQVLVGVAMTEENRTAIRRASKKNPQPKQNPRDQRLSQLVPKLRAEKKLVGLAAMLMVNGKVVESAVDGERKMGDGVPLQLGDRWHLGSITKSMTATMLACLVERKQLKWTTTVGESLGKTMQLHAKWRDVSLEQLLTHTSGAPANFSPLIQFSRPPEGNARVKARRLAVASVLKAAPTSEPGSAFLYSNVGYTVAAAMAEQMTGKSWEDLMRQEVFKPMKLQNADFGPPNDEKQRPDQPLGHIQVGSSKRATGVNEYNTPIIAPAGLVHMPLAELCAFGNEHLQGEQGRGELLKAETYRRLHTAKLDQYACGWIVSREGDLLDQRALWHNGSNTMWYALLVIVPDLKMVVAVTSNDGDMNSAEAAAFEIVTNLAKGREASLQKQPNPRTQPR